MPVELNNRLESLAWAAILIATGVLWLLPEGVAPKGAWLMAVGFILLVLNAARYANGIRMQGLSLILGITALLAGLGPHFGVELPLFAIVLILTGVWLLIAQLFPGGRCAHVQDDAAVGREAR